MIHFAWPWVAVLLPLPVLVHRLLPRGAGSTAGALRVPFFDEVLSSDEGSGERGGSRATSMHLFLWAVWLLVVAAAARPQWLGDAVSLPISGRNLMLAVDVSGSMAQEDFELDGGAATRLAVVKHAALRFIERRSGDRLGLILFGTQAYLQTPLSFDNKTVAAMLNDAVVGIAGNETAIGDAIGLALKRLRDQGAGQRVLVLLTDGANTAGEVPPRQAAALAAREGLRIHTVGLGATRMRVPGFFGDRVINPSAKLDEATLKNIAQTTGGRYFRATDTAGLESIYRELDQLEPAARDAAYFRPRRALYVWPLGLALVLSAAFTARRLGFSLRKPFALLRTGRDVGELGTQ